MLVRFVRAVLSAFQRKILKGRVQICRDTVSILLMTKNMVEAYLALRSVIFL